MIKYSIKAKGWMGAIDRFTRRQQSREALALPPPKTFLEDTQLPMSKLEFNLWMDRNVSHKFHVGQLVCNHFLLETPNTIPHHFKVCYIEEMYPNVRWDPVLREPIVIHIEVFNRSTNEYEIFKRCPSSLRPLSSKEESLVQLQNSQALGTA